jgi:site-specific DNA-methyltransferase (adenine-specific)
MTVTMLDNSDMNEMMPSPNRNIGQLNVQIRHQDCISFLRSIPDNSIDVIVTDPAYSGMNNMLQLGKGRIVGQYNEKGTDPGKWFQEFEDTEENYTFFLQECARVLNRSTGHIYIMFDSFSLLSLGAIVRSFFDVKNIITWDKINIGMGHYFRRRHELIVFATNGNKRKIKHRSFPDIWRFKRIHNSVYSTQKPVELFQTMIFASAEPGFTICDPFVGSGSSAIAAIKNGCHFLGSDISEKAVELANDRIAYYQEYGIDKYQVKPASVDDEPVYWE